jgi:hypothetical protein
MHQRVFLFHLSIPNSKPQFYGYFIVITSWSEYFFFTQKFQQHGKFGIGRFVLDLGILFLFYYIIIAASNGNGENLIPDVYLFVTPLIFFLFTLSDVFRIREYPNKALLKFRNTSRSFLFISILLSLSYLSETYATGFQSLGSLAFYRDLIFGYLTLLLVVIYRIIRWHQINAAVTPQ